MRRPPKEATAVAPVRIDLAGGTLDVWPLPLLLPPPVVTVNVALDLPCRAVARAREDGRIRLVSADGAREAVHPSRDALAEDLARGQAPLPLLGLAALNDGPASGLDLTTSARSPAGGGLGGSSALLVAILGALRTLDGAALDPPALARRAQEIETALLRGPTGYQDYLPALYGGCLAITGGIGGPRVASLPVDLAALGRRLRLVFTGAPHASGLTNWGVLRAYLDGEARTTEAVHEIAQVARDVAAALRAGDLDLALRLVVEEGRVRRRLAPGVATDATDAVEVAARAAGAIGTKILGAGGGGSVLVVVPEPTPEGLDEALQAGPGACYPVRLVSEGLLGKAGQAARR